jgi:hypothetical protein
MAEPPSDPTPPVGGGARGTSTPSRRGLLALAVLGTSGAVLLLLFAVSGSTVSADGTLVEPFGALALGTLMLTGSGLVGLGWLFRTVRRTSTCSRGSC